MYPVMLNLVNCILANECWTKNVMLLYPVFEYLSWFIQNVLIMWCKCVWIVLMYPKFESANWISMQCFCVWTDHVQQCFCTISKSANQQISKSAMFLFGLKWDLCMVLSSWVCSMFSKRIQCSVFNELICAAMFNVHWTEIVDLIEVDVLLFELISNVQQCLLSVSVFESNQ